MNTLMNSALAERGVVYFGTIDSTNICAKQLARQGAPNLTAVLADAQTQGRGRRGRSWLSRPGAGAWLTIIVRPDVAPERASELVLVTSVALAESLTAIIGKPAQIKWPNDILSNGKKLCGTLLEMEQDNGILNFAVIGVGINILGTEFPDDLPDAGSLESVSSLAPNRAAVVESFLSTFEGLYNRWLSHGLPAIMPRYRQLSMTLGREVRAICPDCEFTGTATDIGLDGALIIRVPTGELRTVYSADVSIRPATN